jgi:hypothetical protein
VQNGGTSTSLIVANRTTGANANILTSSLIYEGSKASAFNTAGVNNAGANFASNISNVYLANNDSNT